VEPKVDVITHTTSVGSKVKVLMDPIDPILDDAEVDGSNQCSVELPNENISGGLHRYTMPVDEIFNINVEEEVEVDRAAQVALSVMVAIVPLDGLYL